MKRRVVLALAGVLACGPLAAADVIAFDDAYDGLGDGGDPNDFYPAPTFVGPYFGLVGGLGNGDPGNWDLEGTNGSAFWGFNVDVVGGLMFDDDVIDFSLDISRSAGSDEGQTFSIEFFDDGDLVGSDFIELGPINEWSTIIFNGIAFDEVQFAGSHDGSFSPFGIDNIQYVPAPGALGLLALSGFIGGRRRR